MDWTKINASHLAEFFQLHQITLPPGVSFQTQQLIAQLLLDELPIQSYFNIPHEKITISYQDSFLPFDLIHRIGLNIDYDALPNFCLVSKAVYQLWNNESFWLDKINQDLGMTNCKSGWDHKLYFQEAIDRHYPIKGIENHVYSYRDLILLMFNATIMGKSTVALNAKYDILYSKRIPTPPVDKNFLLQFGEILYQKGITFSPNHRFPSLAITPDIKGNVVSAILDQPDLLLSILSEKEMEYAVLFSSSRIIDHCLKIDSGIYDIWLDIAAAHGSLEMFLLFYPRGNFGYTDDKLLNTAITYCNLPIIKFLIAKSTPVCLDQIEWIISHLPEIVPQLWKTPLSIEMLNYFLSRIAYTPHLDLAQLLINLGANNLSAALTIAQNQHNIWMTKFLARHIR